MPRAFVFDAYGTLFDVHAAIARHRAAAGPDADRLSEIWRGKQLEYTWTLTLAGHYVDFWTLTEQALDFALARVPSVDRQLKAKLLDAYFALDAFPDARAALAGLKMRGTRTAILSNGSPRMLAAAVGAAQLGSHLDAVLSVDAIRMYKPRPEVLCPGDTGLRHCAGRHGVRLIQPLGRDGRRFGRFRHRLGESRRKCRTNMPRTHPGGSLPTWRSFPRLGS